MNEMDLKNIVKKISLMLLKDRWNYLKIKKNMKFAKKMHLKALLMLLMLVKTGVKNFID